MRSARRLIAVEPADEIGAERGEIGLGDHQHVGEGGLPPGFGEAVECRGAVHRVDECHDPGEAQTVVEHRVGAEREQDRRRVGETRRLDDDPAETPDLAGIAAIKKAAQRLRQVFADGAAQTTARQLDHAALDEIDEVMIDRDLADLVDDDGGVGEFGRDQRSAQQRRLAAAEKAGQQGRRQDLRFGHAINHSMADKIRRRSFHAAGGAASPVSQVPVSNASTVVT